MLRKLPKYFQKWKTFSMFYLFRVTIFKKRKCYIFNQVENRDNVKTFFYKSTNLKFDIQNNKKKIQIKLITVQTFAMYFLLIETHSYFFWIFFNASTLFK